MLSTSICVFCLYKWQLLEWVLCVTLPAAINSSLQWYALSPLTLYGHNTHIKFQNAN